MNKFHFPEKIILLLLVFIVGFGFSTPLFSQTFTFEVQIKNQPQNPVIFGKIEGDKFTTIDSATVLNNIVKFEFPENSSPGMYRLVFGQTLYAKIMNESPQQLDFIFNNEHLIFETDFEAPVENLKIILSEENRIWFEFLKRENKFQKVIKELEMEVNYFQQNAKPFEAEKHIESYNQLQEERNNLIIQLIEKNENLFASKLIQLYREPILDGNKTELQRKEEFQKEYFKNLDFTDETIINSNVYSDKIFQYLTSFNQINFTKEQREKEYIKALDIILENTNQNQKVYEFILNYLVHGFEILKMNNVIEYIAEKYSDTTCQTDEKTTLERKLESQKMRIGTVVPDFILNDVNGDPVTLSEVQKDNTLLIFWASWCPHCNEMMPFVKNWINQQTADFEIIAISLDTSKTEWENAVNNLKIESWFNLSDLKEWDGEVATEYNIYATPTMFIIDKNQKILAKPISIIDLNNLVF